MNSEKAKGRGYEMLMYRRDDMLYDLALAFRAGQPSVWPVLTKKQVHDVWSAFVRDGFVRDEAALDNIFESMRDNLLRLECATIVAEHTGLNRNDFIADCGVLDASEHDAFSNWLIDSDDGWRISDYGLDPLTDAIACAFEARTPALKLKCLDRALHVTHQRNDLSKLFVEGGRQTVVELEVTLEEHIA